MLIWNNNAIGKGQLKGNQRAIKGQLKGKQNLAFKPFIEVEGQLKGNQRAIKGQLKGNPIKEKEKEKEKEYICAFVNNICYIPSALFLAKLI